MEEEIDIYENQADQEKAPKSGMRFSNFVLAPHDIGRVEICPASVVFTGPKAPMHPGQWHGIFIHRFMQYVVERGRDAALAYIKSKKQKYVLELCTRMDLSTVPMDGIPEMTMTINTDTMRGETIERDVAEPKTHVAMRADIVFRTDNLWHVGDYKTGKPTEADVLQSVQMLTSATALHLMEDDHPDVYASLIWIEKTGNLLWHTKLIPSAVLRKHAKRVRRAHLLALEIRDEYKQEGCEPEYHPGEHCMGCRMEKTCHVSALRKVA